MNSVNLIFFSDAHRSPPRIVVKNKNEEDLFSLYIIEQGRLQNNNNWRRIRMVFQLAPLNEDTLYEHIFERYVELERNSANLKQDLGIQSRTATTIEIDIEPPPVVLEKKKRKKRQNERRADAELYNVVVEQSLSDLNSSVSNNNSTTGYVLWSSTPFFIRWLLYSDESKPFRFLCDAVEVTNNRSLGDDDDDDDNEQNVEIPPLYSVRNENSRVGIIELGTGISPLMAVILSNHVDHYVCTDQRGILNKLKQNIKENVSQVTRRECISKSLGIERREVESTLETTEQEDNSNKRGSINSKSSRNSATVSIEVEELNWEKFDPKVNHPYLTQVKDNCDTVYIVAMDVIYNEYLIEPFLTTIINLRSFFSDADKQRTTPPNVRCLIGVHLRSQDIVTQFLEQAVINHELSVYSIADNALDASRYAIYLI